MRIFIHSRGSISSFRDPYVVPKQPKQERYAQVAGHKSSRLARLPVPV